MTQSSNSKQLSSRPSSPISLDSMLMTMPTSDSMFFTHRARATPMDSPEDRTAIMIEILDEVLDMLNEDVFEDDHNIGNPNANHALQQ
ncbi:unnamed protein product [Cylindrotheca closterium]|uniref:Uncharacterized protein n=1 Tax=Cylindrotheca closterium TaxID=2856 RepID=A0AAD2CSI3_9STRA|nr:unnamed protein product [Cylindrotheca closterium]CAJ1945058.1 unnamed protein product [Cylindrotheca closterium]